MNLGERLELQKKRQEKVKQMNDSQKLEYLVSILSRNIDMLTDCSDTHGIDFTEEYEEQQNEIEDFLNAIK